PAGKNSVRDFNNFASMFTFSVRSDHTNVKRNRTGEAPRDRRAVTKPVLSAKFSAVISQFSITITFIKSTLHFCKGHAMTFSKIVAGIVVLVFLGGVVFTQEAGKDEKPAKDKPASKPATHKVEKKPFKIELNLKGILEAEEAAEIAYRPHPLVMPPP